MAMENNNLKEKIRKNVKEKIAISNIREEFGMKNNKNKKTIYYLTSGVASVFILGFGIIIGTNKLNNNQLQNEPYQIADLQQEKQDNKEENLKIELNINKIKDLAMTSLDADIKTIEIDKLLEQFEFMKNISIPNGYKLESSYNIYTRKDANIKEYNLLHDYVFNYSKDSINKITVSFSEIEKPIRDYYIKEGDKISQIGDVELIISEWKQMYIVTFEYNNIYFDIETVGITENELLELLKSILIENTNKNTHVEDKE